MRYDIEKRSKAGKAAALRAVVAVYICYLAFKIASAENTSMSVTACRIIGAVFMAAGIAFVVYTYKQFHKDMKASVLSDEAEESADEAETEEVDE